MRYKSNLSIEEQRELLREFCEAFLSLKKLDEMVEFLIDLLSKKEAITLAKRLKIAKMLIKGKTYQEIQEEIKVSAPTIAKVAEWLEAAGKGFKTVTERVREKKIEGEFSGKDFKKKYGTYFWPEILLKEVFKKAKKEEKEKLLEALEKLDKKSLLYKELNDLFKKYF